MRTYFCNPKNLIYTRCKECYRIEEIPCNPKEWKRLENGEPFQNVLTRAVAEDYYFMKYNMCKECYRRVNEQARLNQKSHQI